MSSSGNDGVYADSTRHSEAPKAVRPSLSPPGSLSHLQREVGRHIGAARGATVMVVCGVHGNEPAGVLAAQRIFSRLERGDIQVAGELVVFAGNLAGLRAGVRYQARDLNRVWSESTIAELRTRDDHDPEDAEQRELLAAMEAAQGRARGRVVVADFHTTSANGIPFILFGDTLLQRRFVRVFPIPILIGLEEQVDGVLSAYWTRRGCVTFTCEGGQHTSPESIDNLEAVLWLTMTEAGLIDASLNEVRRATALLEERRSNLPRAIEVVSRHAISEEDAFCMEPGFRNLDHAEQGRLLARDKRGEIRAKVTGMVIMPLYQGLGNDGYFWGKEVTFAGMKASEWMRKLRVDRLFDFLPGVARDPVHAGRLVIREAHAHLVPIHVLHMFGYRKTRRTEGQITLERQD